MENRTIFSFLKFFLLILSVCVWLSACKKNPTNPEDEFNVVSISPTNGESGVSVNTPVTVVFSSSVDRSSISVNSIKIENITDGTFEFNDQDKTVKFTPSERLSYTKTYSVTVSNEVKNYEGKNLQREFNSSFTTGESQIPIISYPLMIDNRWMYHHNSNSSGNAYENDQIYYVVEDSKNFNGKICAEIHGFGLYDYGLSKLNNIYLSNEQDCLWKWDDYESKWLKILGPDISLSSKDINWFFALDAKQYAEVTISIEDVTVPAGTYNSLRIYHQYQDYGPYNTADISETIYEYHSNMAGLISCNYNYSYDDNDPQGLDWFFSESYELTGFNSTNIPSICNEIEPNPADTIYEYQILYIPTAILGDAKINDQGDIETWPFISENENGEKKIQDWFYINFENNITIHLYYSLPLDNVLQFYVMKYDNYYIYNVLDRSNSNGVETIDLDANYYYVIAVQALKSSAADNNYIICFK